MGPEFFQIQTKFGTCYVNESLRTFDVSSEEYLEKWEVEADRPEGISVRRWWCRWKDGVPVVLLGQRAAHDSSPNRYEAWGGKVDPGEKILEALIREFREETGVTVTCIREKVGNNDVFTTPNSGRRIEQVHFLVQVEKCGEADHTIVLDKEEHQSYRWTSGKVDNMTEASCNHIEEALAEFRKIEACPSGEKP